MKTFPAAAAALAGLGSTVYAQTAQTCPKTNVCYSLNIPDSTASSGTGDIYFQISAPTSYAWVALGQGTQMSGANIFVLYQDASGTNVTISPRLGTGHSQPQYNSAAQVTLLAGSGVSNGIMTANVRCSSCHSWSGGSMDFSSSSGNFIYAVKSGSALDSDSTSASISQHDSAAAFSFDFSQAKGGSSSDPFLTSDATTSSVASGSSGASGSASTKAASSCTAAKSATLTSTIASPTGSGCPTAWPSSWSSGWPSTRPTQYASCFASGWQSGSWPTAPPYIKFIKRDSDDTCSDSSSGSDQGPPASGSSGPPGSSGSQGGPGTSPFGLSNAGIPFGGDFEKANRIFMAHGIMAALAFVILFPFGAISVRLFSFPGLVWAHAFVQLLGYLLFIIAFGLGIYMATQLRELNEAHPIIGILLFVLLFFQPILGLLHHRYFKAHSRRSFWSHAHVWLGRIVITLGIVNGGLGLQLADNSRSGEIAYAVVAAVVWLAYVAAAVVGERRRRNSLPPSYDKSVQMGQVRSRDNDSGSQSPPRHGEWYGKRT
ncbi:hypothetical protein MBLNU459_g3657t1 [Dothideomycetes sp. NU459]